MTAPQRLVVLLPVLLSASMIAALLLVQKRFHAGAKTATAGGKLAVVAEPVTEQATEEPSPAALLAPVTGWTIPGWHLFGGGVGLGLGNLIRPAAPLGLSALKPLKPPAAGEDDGAKPLVSLCRFLHICQLLRAVMHW